MADPPDDPSFAILTSLRYDEALMTASASLGQQRCPLYMPTLHHDRILTSWRYFGWSCEDEERKHPWEGTTEEFMTWILDEVGKWQGGHEEHKGEPLKVRLVITRNGSHSLTFSPIPPVPLSNLYPPTLDSLLVLDIPNTEPNTAAKPHTTLHLDTQPTVPPPHNAHKSTHRSIYDAARSRLSISGTDSDVLLFNTIGEVMETSISTVYVKLEGRWITPPLASGCQTGTTRRWALEKGLCMEGEVGVEMLREGLERLEGVVVSNGVRGFSGATIAR